MLVILCVRVCEMCARSLGLDRMLVDSCACVARLGRWSVGVKRPQRLAERTNERARPADGTRDDHDPTQDHEVGTRRTNRRR